jgi:hypothetical protein
MASADPSAPSERVPPEPPTVHFAVLAAFVFAVAVLKGLRLPSTWAATHMTFNYSQGFIRRGLFGQVLRVFGETRCYRYSFLYVCSAILFVAAAVGLGLLIRRMRAGDRGDRGLAAAILVLATSPGIPFLVHEIGYLDYVGLAAMPCFLLWAARSQRRFAIFYVAIPLSVVLALIHESMIAMFAPALIFALVCHVVARGAALPRRTQVLLVVHVGLAAGAALLASLLVGTLGNGSDVQLRALQESIARHANFVLRGDAFDAVQRSLRDNLLFVLPKHWKDPVNRNYLITSLGVTLPGLGFLAVYGVRLLGRLDLTRRARALLTSLLLLATVAPLLLNFIGWDSARWNAIAFMACFFCLASIRLFLVPPAASAGRGHGHHVADRLTLTWAAMAMVAGLCTSYYGFLFDARVVQWFPFVDQIKSAVDMFKRGLDGMP